MDDAVRSPSSTLSSWITIHPFFLHRMFPHVETLQEWQSSLYSLLQNQTFNQVEVDLFELMCKVLDQNLFAQVDWARNSYYFKELKVGTNQAQLSDKMAEVILGKSEGRRGLHQTLAQ